MKDLIGVAAINTTGTLALADIGTDMAVFGIIALNITSVVFFSAKDAFVRWHGGRNSTD